jgi:hypothetical protein
MRRTITDDWSIDLAEGFQSRVRDEMLQFVSAEPPLRTVWISVWGPPSDEAPADVLAEVLKDVNPDPVEHVRDANEDETELHYASWYPEEGRDGGRQWGLYAYTIRRGTYVQLACLVDDGDEVEGREWALATWRSLRYEGAAA